jgi:hypothetical protein
VTRLYILRDMGFSNNYSDGCHNAQHKCRRYIFGFLFFDEVGDTVSVMVAHTYILHLILHSVTDCLHRPLCLILSGIQLYKARVGHLDILRLATGR